MIELESKPKMTAPQYERVTQDLREWMSQEGTGANANSKATGGSSSVHYMDSSKHVNTIVICAVISTIGALAGIAAYVKADKAETESRMTQYYLMDPHSRTPEELAAWAKFNREYEQQRKASAEVSKSK